MNNERIVRKEIIGGIAIYKFVEDFIRYLLGVFLVIFNFSLNKITLYFFRKELIQDPNDFFFNFITAHIRQVSIPLTKFLAIFLIIFSLLEISFLIGLLFRKKWGAIGFFIMQFLWVPIDLLIVSRFLLFSKIITITLEVIIVWFMIRLLTSPKGYFKR